MEDSIMSVPLINLMPEIIIYLFGKSISFLSRIFRMPGFSSHLHVYRNIDFGGSLHFNRSISTIKRLFKSIYKVFGVMFLFDNTIPLSYKILQNK